MEAVLEAAAANDFGGDPALAALAMTGDLVEQYLHPSNNGQCVLLHCCTELNIGADAEALRSIICTIRSLTI